MAHEARTELEARWDVEARRLLAALERIPAIAAPREPSEAQESPESPQSRSGTLPLPRPPRARTPHSRGRGGGGGSVGDVILAVVGAVVGYTLGVLRALSESRNERRDAALADIYKELALFYRYLGSWTGDDSDPKNPPPRRRGCPRGSTSKVSSRGSPIPSTTLMRYGLGRVPTN
jgi:hypothetical protein